MGGYQPDILASSLKVIFCGINPATSAEVSGHSFSAPSNRFWNVLCLSGFTKVRLRPEDEHRLLEYQCGLTAVVRRSTRQANEISRKEFQEARLEFERRMRTFAPRSIAFLGKRAFTSMMDIKNVSFGCQPIAFGGLSTWILPNPSGRNRRYSLAALVGAYSELYVALEQPSR